MKTLLSAYLWGYDKPEAADITFKKYREFYPEGEIYFRMDIGPGSKEDQFKEVCNKWNAHFSKNPIQVGRCGWMGHYENYEEQGVELKRECWPQENAFIWMDGIYEVCKNCNSKYLIVLEDDTYILKPINILNEDFGISVAEYNFNVLPYPLVDLVYKLGGNINIPTNIYGVLGYGAMGGFILNCEQFIESWDKFRPILQDNWDVIRQATHLIGWCDVLPQLTIMVGGFKVVMNKQHVQTWYDTNPSLFPGFTHWKDYEIVDFLKDIEIIKQL